MRRHPSPAASAGPVAPCLIVAASLPLALAVAGCGGKGAGEGGDLTVAGRTRAVQETVASAPECTSLTPFYWEMGDASGRLASGAGGEEGAAVDPSVAMPIASASKLIFGAYALERQSLAEIAAAGDIPYLNFTSGYHGLSDLLCDLAATVGGCLQAGANGALTPGDVGRFYYNGAHLQAYAVAVSRLGDDCSDTYPCTPKLSDEVQAWIGDIGLGYGTPGLAGGARISPSGYALFLRHILAGDLAIRDHLGEAAVCAWTHHDDCGALYSPVNESSPAATGNDVSDLRWHYSLAHWVEDDGAFSSAGAFGFYPFLDASRTYYGILARHDTRVGAMPPPYYASVACGRLIRAAWLSGAAQQGARSEPSRVKTTGARPPNPLPARPTVERAPVEPSGA
ncbi:MAG TPA: hypothetical protein VMU15_18280 [Anaeromyxobacter sp.]|nr:hypothetical protein [Anaeromyxobacter sp.]